MSEEANGIDELPKEPCSPEENELNSLGDDDLSAPNPECNNEANDKQQVEECTGQEESPLESEEKIKATGNSPAECPGNDKLSNLTPKEENDCSSKDKSNDELCDKLSNSSPEPGELPDDDDLAGESIKKIKKESWNEIDSEKAFEGVKRVNECNTPENTIPLKIKKEQNDLETVKSVDDSWEEQTNSPNVKQEFYSDLEDDIPPKTPEIKLVEKDPEPPKKLAGIFEKKIKKEDGSGEGILQEKLKQYFGHNDFKSALQKEAIQTIITSE